MRGIFQRGTRSVMEGGGKKVQKGEESHHSSSSLLAKNPYGQGGGRGGRAILSGKGRCVLETQLGAMNKDGGVCCAGTIGSEKKYSGLRRPEWGVIKKRRFALSIFGAGRRRNSYHQYTSKIGMRGGGSLPPEDIKEARPSRGSDEKRA